MNEASLSRTWDKLAASYGTDVTVLLNDDSGYNAATGQPIRSVSQHEARAMFAPARVVRWPDQQNIVQIGDMVVQLNGSAWSRPLKPGDTITRGTETWTVVLASALHGALTQAIVRRA